MFEWTRRSVGASCALVVAGCSGVRPGDLFDAPWSDGGVGPGASDAGTVRVALDAAGTGASAAPPIDAGTPAVEAGGADEGPDPPDAGIADAAPAACNVTFIVTGATVDGLSIQGVYLGGDDDALGHWDPNAARPMTQLSPGVWTTNLAMSDGAQLQFRFLERGPLAVQWESWGLNSNRSLRVACLTSAGDAAAPDGGSSPVVGTEYTGQFGAKPPDAT